MRGQLIQTAENNFLVKCGLQQGCHCHCHSHEIEPRTEQPAQQAFPFGFGSTEKDRGTGFLVLAAREMKREPEPHGIETRRLTTEIRREPFTRAVFVLVKTCSCKWYSLRLIQDPRGYSLIYAMGMCLYVLTHWVGPLACKNIRFSSPPTAKSEKKRMFTQTSRFLPRFGLKTGHGFRGNCGVYAYLQFQFQMRKKEREICEFQMDLNFFFVCSLI